MVRKFAVRDTLGKMHRALIVIVVALTATSCADLDAIARFARASNDAGISYRAIAAEAPASCERATIFVLANQQPPDCEAFARLEAPMALINEVYFTYLAALGSLAGADVARITSGLSTVRVSLRAGDPAISTADLARADAAAGLATILTRLLTSRYREREVRAIMREANPAVKELSTFLAIFAAGKYEQGLRDERTRERRFCFDRIRRNIEREPLAAVLVRRQCDLDIASLDRKLAGIAAYRRAVETSAKAHDRLASTDRKWNDVLFRSVLPDIQQLTDAAVTARNAF